MTEVTHSFSVIIQIGSGLPLLCKYHPNTWAVEPKSDRDARAHQGKKRKKMEWCDGRLENEWKWTSVVLSDLLVQNKQKCGVECPDRERKKKKIRVGETKAGRGGGELDCTDPMTAALSTLTKKKKNSLEPRKSNPDFVLLSQLKVSSTASLFVRPVSQSHSFRYQGTLMQIWKSRPNASRQLGWTFRHCLQTHSGKKS